MSFKPFDQTRPDIRSAEWQPRLIEASAVTRGRNQQAHQRIGRKQLPASLCSQEQLEGGRRISRNNVTMASNSHFI